MYQVDGIMIGRAAIGNPWIFNEIKYFLNSGRKLSRPPLSTKINVVKKHLVLSIDWKGERKGIHEMRRHYANYFREMPNFKTYRNKLVHLDSYQEINDLLDEILIIFAPEYSLV